MNLTEESTVDQIIREDSTSYLINLGEGNSHYQRKDVIKMTDNPLTNEEKVIIKLCQYFLYLAS